MIHYKVIITTNSYTKNKYSYIRKETSLIIPKNVKIAFKDNFIPEKQIRPDGVTDYNSLITFLYSNEPFGLKEVIAIKEFYNKGDVLRNADYLTNEYSGLPISFSETLKRFYDRNNTPNNVKSLEDAKLSDYLEKSKHIDDIKNNFGIQDESIVNYRERIILQKDRFRYTFKYDNIRERYKVEYQESLHSGSIQHSSILSIPDTLKKIRDLKQKGYSEFRNTNEVSWYATLENNTPYDEEWVIENGHLIPVKSYSITCNVN